MGLCVCIKRNTNRRLTGLLNVLPLFHGVDEAEQLAVSLISAYPDQMHWYLPSLKTQLTPRLSTQWVASIQLLYQVNGGSLQIYAQHCRFILRLLDADVYTIKQCCLTGY